jgi:hypothetical protein
MFSLLVSLAQRTNCEARLSSGYDSGNNDIYFLEGHKELALSHGLTQLTAQEMKWPYTVKQRAVCHISALAPKGHHG